MFVKLTNCDGFPVYINTDRIRKFYVSRGYTVLDMDYGKDVVKETPGQIMEKMEREKQ